MTRTLTATIDEAVYPVDLGRVSAGQVARLRRDVAVSLDAVAAMVDRGDGFDPETLAVAASAVAGVSIEQRGIPVDLMRVADLVPVAASVQITYDDGEPEAPVPAEPEPEPGLTPQQQAAVNAAVHAALATATAHGSTPS